MTKVSNCGHDESWRYSGGMAGDQTGSEWWVINWYNFGQNVVLRHPDAKVRAMIAEMARAAAENPLVGYDQNQRETFWQQLQKVGYRPQDIRVKCEADCSAGVAAIVKGAGYRLGIDKLKAVSPKVYTGNERAALVAAGFQALTATKYLTSGDYLLAGDINLNERSHTNICVTSGSKSGATTGTIGSTGGSKLDVDGILGAKSVTKWQQVMGTYVDGIVSGQYRPNAKYFAALTAVEFGGEGSALVRAIQKVVVATQDGILGPETIKGIQKRMGVEIDGYLGSQTAKAIQKRLNEGRF